MKTLVNKLRGIAKAGITSSLISLASFSPTYADDISPPTAPKPPVYEKTTNSQNQYTFERFKTALGNRYIPEQEKELKKNWEDHKGQTVNQLICEIYETPKKIESIMSEETRKKYNSFNIDSIKLSQLKKYEEITPWNLIPDNLEFDKSTKLVLFAIDSKLILDYENATKKYTFERFKTALNHRFIPEQEKPLNTLWNNMENYDREFICRAYENPDKFKKEGLKEMMKIRGHTDEECNSFIQKAYSPDINSLTLSDLKKYERVTPWDAIPDNLKFSETDKLILFLFGKGILHNSKSPKKTPIKSPEELGEELGKELGKAVINQFLLEVQKDLNKAKKDRIAKELNRYPPETRFPEPPQ